MHKRTQTKPALRPLTPGQLAIASGGDIGNDWLVGGTGQDAPSGTSGTGKTLTAALLGNELPR